MFMVTRNLRRWRDRGAAAVEFALVVPLLITLIFGAIEFGLAVQARTMVANAAREGVRVASLGGTDADARLAVTTALVGITSAGPAVITTSCTVPTTLQSCVLGAATGNRGNLATVTVTVHYVGVTGLFPLLTNAALTGDSYMRIEH
jgi:Flp pilus assembly protein TadG